MYLLELVASKALFSIQVKEAIPDGTEASSICIPGAI